MIWKRPGSPNLRIACPSLIKINVFKLSINTDTNPIIKFQFAAFYCSERRRVQNIKILLVGDAWENPIPFDWWPDFWANKKSQKLVNWIKLIIIADRNLNRSYRAKNLKKQNPVRNKWVTFCHTSVCNGAANKKKPQNKRVSANLKKTKDERHKYLARFNNLNFLPNLNAHNLKIKINRTVDLFEIVWLADFSTEKETALFYLINVRIC